jgi:hypothetical protein
MFYWRYGWASASLPNQKFQGHCVGEPLGGSRFDLYRRSTVSFCPYLAFQFEYVAAQLPGFGLSLSGRNAAKTIVSAAL